MAKNVFSTVLPTEKKYFSFGEEVLLGFVRKLPKIQQVFLSLLAVKGRKQNQYLSLSALHI